MIFRRPVNPTVALSDIPRSSTVHLNAPQNASYASIRPKFVLIIALSWFIR